MHRKKILLLFIILLFAASLFFTIKYFSQAKTLEKLEEELSAQKTNGKVVNFLSLFIEKVLKSEKEISFEDRLKLENAVRDMDDEEILLKWEKFTGGVTEKDIQQGVKELLEILVKKISY